MRTALGASRRRLVRQVVTECVVLCLCGALAGITLAWWGARAIVGLVSDEITLWNTPSVDWRVIGFAIGLSVTTGVLFGWLPAMTSSRWRPQDAMRGGAGSVTRSGRRTRAALTFVQIALALVLLVCASLLISSLTRVLHVDPGFRAQDVITFRVTPSRATYADAPAIVAYYESLLERLRTLPGLAGIGAVSGLPLAGNSTVRGVIRPGDPVPEPNKLRLALYQVATPGYVSAIGMNLLRGRDFTDADSSTSPPVAIINESMAQTLWGTTEVVGREILIHTDEKLPRTVVGVFADVHHYGLDARVDPHYFVPLRQAPVRTMSLALRLSKPIAPADLRRATASVDPALPIYEVRTVDEILQRSLSSRKALAVTLTLFGAARAHARGGWSLRHGRRGRLRTTPGDRHPTVAWRNPAAGAATIRAPGHARRGRRHNRRADPHELDHAARSGVPVRGDATRLAESRRRGRGRARRGARRDLDPGASGGGDRSGGDAAR